MTGLIKPLRRRHAGLCAHAQLAAGFLLQGRGHEGRPGVAARGLGGDTGDFQIARGNGRNRQHRVLFGRDIEPLQLLAAIDGQRGVILVAARRRQPGMDRPVFAGLEGLDLHLAVDDDAQRDRLHAARRLGARQLAPQDRRQVEADQIIQRPARQIGIDQGLVDLARIGHGLGHGGFGDGVEGDAADGGALFQHRPQRLFQMPGNRLALTIRVGRKDQVGIIRKRILDRLDVLFGIRRDFPFHREFVVGIDAAILGRQVADMPE